MHLSHLRLVGFKSFPQETHISFEPGITAIVGPNGCGKSNIGDAIRWVLGEQGHRIIRAERMEDVIFNGNGTCQPLGMAEVSLTISGHEGELPTEFSEINITRRLFRSGESQYFLNGAPCLLRDILNLFLDSGLGSMPYALLEQGSVASVVDSKPGENKAMIDEAAGIMKYKLRRKVAIAKVQAAEQNLLRLGDIISEVEQQRNLLSRQAKKAREYEETRKRIEYLEANLRIQEYQDAETEFNEVARNLKEKTDERVSLVTRVGQYESQLVSEQLHLVSLQGFFQETQQSLYRIRGEMEKAQGQVEILLQEGEELREMEGKTRADLIFCASQVEQLQEAMAEERKRIQIAKEVVDSLSKKGEELRQQGEDLSRDITRLAQLGEEKRREAIRAAALCSNIRNQRIALENQSLKLCQQAKKLEAQQEETSSEIAKIREKDVRLEKRLEHLNRCFTECHSQRTQVAADLASTLKQEKETDIALMKLQRQVDEFSARLSSYEDLQKAHSEYGEGAQFLLQNRNSSNPSLPHMGLVMALSELLETTSGCERAIESLLGSELQGLVMESMEEIRRIIRGVEPLRKGGAIFLPLSFFSDSWGSKISSAPSERFLSLPGVVGWAIDLIKYEPRYEGLMKRLFPDSLVVEDLETAMEVCRQSRRPRTVATLRGEVITSWGAIRLPSDSSSGLLVRRREIKELSRKLKEARERLDQTQARKEVLLDRSRRLNERSDSLAKEEQVLQMEGVALEKDRNQTSMDLKRAGQQMEYLAMERSAIEEEDAQLKAGLLKLREEEREQEKLHLMYEEETRDLQASLEALKDRGKQILEKRESCAKDLRLQEEEEREKGMQLARMEEQVNSLLQRREQLDKELVEIQQRRSKVKGSLQEKEKILHDLSSQEAGVSDALLGIGKQREEASSRSARIQEELTPLKMQISEIDRALSDLQIKEAQIEQDIHHLRPGLSSSEFSDFAQLRQRYREERIKVSEAQEELLKLKERCRKLEPVNMAALVDYESLTKRYLFLNAQAEDLRGSASSLRRTISEINKTTERLFDEAFCSIDRSFAEYCTVLFGGGSARLRLRSSEEAGEGMEEEGGVEIMVSPPGKHLAHLNLLSGGEKALAGLAFLMALFRYRPSPFCLLDEVDAPLDDANVDRFLSLLKELSKRHQFILITHNKRTMEAAECLYGVTMEEPGISKVVSVKLDGNRGRKRHRDMVQSLMGEKNGD